MEEREHKENREGGMTEVVSYGTGIAIAMAGGEGEKG